MSAVNEFEAIIEVGAAEYREYLIGWIVNGGVSRAAAANRVDAYTAVVSAEAIEDARREWRQSVRNFFQGEPLRGRRATVRAMADHQEAHPGYTRHELPAFVDNDRCTEVLIGSSIRCQLIVHDDRQHVAMVAISELAKAGAPEFVKWGDPWTKVEPGHGRLSWSPSFPRVEL